MNRPPDLMFPFVGGKRRLRGILLTVTSVPLLIGSVLLMFVGGWVLTLPGLLFGGTFLWIGIECLRPTVLFVREHDVLEAWSPRSHRQWLFSGLHHGQATKERLRLTYVSDSDAPVEFTLVACDFTPASWWPMVSAIRDRAQLLNPDMSFSLVEDLAVLPKLTDEDYAAFYPPSPCVVG